MDKSLGGVDSPPLDELQFMQNIMDRLIQVRREDATTGSFAGGTFQGAGRRMAAQGVRRGGAPRG